MSLREIDPWTGMFAQKLLEALGGMITSNELKKIERVLTIGGGNCTDTLGLVMKYAPHALVFACDPTAEPAFSLFEKAEIKLFYSKCKFEDFDLKEIIKDKKTLVEISHVLQLFSKTEQLQMLRKIKWDIGPGGMVILVDEVKRPGLDGMYDWLLNRLFNRFKGGYNRQSSVFAFKQLVGDAGFEILAIKQFYRGSVVLVLKVKND